MYIKKEGMFRGYHPLIYGLSGYLTAPRIVGALRGGLPAVGGGRGGLTWLSGSGLRR